MKCWLFCFVDIRILEFFQAQVTCEQLEIKMQRLEEQISEREAMVKRATDKSTADAFKIAALNNKNQVLMEKAKALQLQERTLIDKEIAINSRLEALHSREAGCAEDQQRISSDRQKLDQQLTVLQNKEQALKETEKGLAAKLGSLEIRQSKITELKATCDEHDRALDARTARLSEAEKNLADQETQLATEKTKWAEKQKGSKKQLKQLEDARKAANRELQKKETAFKKKDDELRKQISEFEEYKTREQLQLDRNNKELSDREAQHAKKKRKKDCLCCLGKSSRLVMVVPCNHVVYCQACAAQERIQALLEKNGCPVCQGAVTSQTTIILAT
jgi:chromosome segregation ATPase